MRSKTRILFKFIVVAAVLAGCAGVVRQPDSPADVAQGYLAQGRASEKAGKWVDASRYYKLALTIEPQNRAIADSVKRVDAMRIKIADVHYRKGLQFLKQGKYSDGQRQFLTALRYWPQHKAALEQLQSRTQIKAKRFIVHIVQKGETVSIISKKYYNDPKQFQTIARFNNLPDATTIQVGKELKIPEIEGLPFLVPEGSSEITADAKIMDGQLTIRDWEYEQEQKTKEIQEDAKAFDNMVAGYRDAGIELFQEKKYDEAIIEFKKVVNADPQDFETQEYIYKAHLNSARSLLEAKDYHAADRRLQACLDFKSDCQQCRTIIQQCENSYKELHYQLGIQYFGEEKLENAINEWKLVKKLDPNYKQVEENIRRAEKISNKIRQLKEESKE